MYEILEGRKTQCTAEDGENLKFQWILMWFLDLFKAIAVNQWVPLPNTSARNEKCFIRTPFRGSSVPSYIALTKAVVRRHSPNSSQPSFGNSSFSFSSFFLNPGIDSFQYFALCGGFILLFVRQVLSALLSLHLRLASMPSLQDEASVSVPYDMLPSLKWEKSWCIAATLICQPNNLRPFHWFLIISWW